MFTVLSPSFILILLVAMVGIPLYLVAYGGLSGPDLSSYIVSKDKDFVDDDKDEKNGEKPKRKKKRPHDDPGSPLDIGDLGGLGGLVGLCALVVIAFTLFPQELNGVMNSVSGGLDLSAYTPWGSGDGALGSDGGVPLGGTIPLRTRAAPPVTVFPGKTDKVRMKPSFNTVSRHLRILRAQPVLLVGYNEDHMSTLAAILGAAAVLPAAYIFGQMLWDSQDIARHQARLDASEKMAAEDLKKAEMYGKRAEWFEEDAKRIRNDKINLLEEIKTMPPWWDGDLTAWKARELYRRREETNTLAERSSSKATLFKKREQQLKEKWLPTETTRGGQTEKEENLFPGIPLLTYMRLRSNGKTAKTALDKSGLLKSYEEPTKLMMDTEDLTSRSKFNSEGEKQHPHERLGIQKGLRAKLYKRWWEEDRDNYLQWSRDEKFEVDQEEERKTKEAELRPKLEETVKRQLLLGTKPGEADGGAAGFYSQVPSRQAVRTVETPPAESSKGGSGGGKEGKDTAFKVKKFFKAILP